MVSIKDIAEKANVSISTVSYALNGSPKITEETRNKILKIAKELNYVPNAAARTLKKSKTNIIGAFVTDYSGQFFGPLLLGIKNTLSTAGYDLVVCTGKESRRFLPEGIIDGAIVLDATYPTDEILKYAERGHKLVLLDREINHENINSVLLDNETGAELAVQELLNIGLKHIVILSGPENSYDSISRLNTARKILEQYPEIQTTVINGDFDKESGAKAGEKIIENYSEPVGVFCLNDEMAIGMYNFLEKTDYEIGRHIYIIGFDNIELAGYIRPRLTTINYSRENWGALAADAMIQLLNNEKVKFDKIPVELIRGESTTISKE